MIDYWQFYFNIIVIFNHKNTPAHNTPVHSLSHPPGPHPSFPLHVGKVAPCAAKLPHVLLSCFSHVQLCATLWSVALQTPLSMGILQARALEWVACPPPGDNSQAREGTRISDVS